MEVLVRLKTIQNERDLEPELSRDEVVEFLFRNLGEYGDPKEYIDRSISYAFSESEGKGGFLLAGFDDNELVTVLVMNETGMSGYIPENVLVYVATKKEARGEGFGTKTVKKAFEIADTDIKLHVEHDNPAKRLYERLGMENTYAEMRYKKE